MRLSLRKFTSITVPRVENGAILVSWRGRRLYSDTAKVAPAPAAEAVSEAARAPLTDLQGRRHNYLRISLTERCNLRCQYCMPPEGAALSPRERLLTRAELARAARVFASLGVDKLRLTGGEPTLRADLADIIQELSSIDGIRAVGMTTNGLVLTRRLPALQRAGLAALNVSLDSLRPERYERMARRPGLARVLAGVDLALQLGYRPLKINTVLMKGFNDDEICDFVELTRDREVEVRFIEFMPFSGNAWDDSKLVPYRAALRAVTARHPALRPRTPRPHDTARVWQVPGYLGSVGFIASMTQHFCNSCNRLRLTADGNLKVCLFGNAEVSLRDAIRAGADDAALARLVRAALRNKKPQHAGSRAHGEPADGADRRLARGSRLPAARATRGAWLPAATARSGAWLPPTSAVPSHARCYGTRVDDDGDETDGAQRSAFTHLDGSGRARMVDVGDKPVTRRTAVAACRVLVSARLLRLLRDARVPKGDALAVAQVAGALAAKRTADLIPLCHPLPLDMARVRVHLPDGDGDGDRAALEVTCSVRVTARTGAEMEALTGCAVAALALYDMCKAVDRGMRVTDLRVVRKAGGRSGDWAEPAEPRPAPTDAAPPGGAPRPEKLETRASTPKRPNDSGDGPYAPINFSNF